jgi:putative hydrolase of the HAD superfamily
LRDPVPDRDSSSDAPGIAAILFDWGETLVSVPGMIHSAERHLSCVERMYCGANGADCASDRFGVAWPAFRDAYLAEVAHQLAHSTTSGREHSFEDRLAGALARLGLEQPPRDELSGLVDRLGEHIVADAALVDGVQEVVPALARHYRLGIVSNYPCAPLVARTMERFGLLDCFSAVVVSGEWGWMKPHPGIYREALRRLDVEHRQALFVGDDLVNDVKGPKAVGMRAAWFAPGRKREDRGDADVHIGDLRELLAWCRDHHPSTRVRA